MKGRRMFINTHAACTFLITWWGYVDFLAQQFYADATGTHESRRKLIFYNLISIFVATLSQTSSTSDWYYFEFGLDTGQSVKFSKCPIWGVLKFNSHLESPILNQRTSSASYWIALLQLYWSAFLIKFHNARIMTNRRLLESLSWPEHSGRCSSKWKSC